MSRIKSLDLRPEPAKEFLDWDWPHFPRRAVRFLAGQPIVAHSARVEQKWSLSSGTVRFVNCTFSETWPSVEDGSFIWRPWSRWNLNANWTWYFIVIGLALLLGLVVGVIWH